MSDMTKSVVIISGGSRGLGLAITQYLLESGYAIATFSRTKTEAIELIEKGSYAEAFLWEQIDSTDTLAVEDFVKRIYKKYKRLDGIINNVGVAEEGVLSLMKQDHINRLISVNLGSTIALIRSGIKYMLAKKGGVVINISSIIGVRGYSGLSIYSATKGAMDAMTRSLARELGGRNIRVNSVAPGYLETDMSESLNPQQRNQIIRRTPLARLGGVEDIVGMIRFLMSDEAKFMTGQTLIIDGGITC
ncbi:SDR family NAD(P)-dependent oxidoreductase [Cellvibrio sp. QJXJ]|uniref:SDR family NAD(P)-dependent oxidoreductase n=1 Tax=Cellvibrio sp. QJXJ TaxID=2964606 RepID=UPI0021C31A77|nr:SDR family oxidoreductase [Cellvibrio sp. QJXJ]UUA73392.1 SDR family oxidoreductase [Cellvibrio sp. QJXJ]